MVQLKPRKFNFEATIPDLPADNSFTDVTINHNLGTLDIDVSRINTFNPTTGDPRSTYVDYFYTNTNVINGHFVSTPRDKNSITIRFYRWVSGSVKLKGTVITQN